MRRPTTDAERVLQALSVPRHHWAPILSDPECLAAIQDGVITARRAAYAFAKACRDTSSSR